MSKDHTDACNHKTIGNKSNSNDVNTREKPEGSVFAKCAMTSKASTPGGAIKSFSGASASCAGQKSIDGIFLKVLGLRSKIEWIEANKP